MPAPQQILIELIGDTTQLQPAFDMLESLGVIDAKTADSYRKSNAELAKRTQVIKTVAAEEQKQVKTLKDVEKAVESLGDAVQHTFKDQLAEYLADAGASVADFDKFLQELNSTTEKTEGAQSSLKKQLREMTAQLAQMEVQGKRNTAEYNELVASAGELRDAIGDANDAISNAGSDTRGLDNVIALAGGVAGGFAVAQGAAALFGDESEEVQKILLKVNAAMAILQGLQQIQDLMSKRQFASTAALVGIQRVQALQTGLQTAAESNYVIVRYAAIAAQKVLNAVMACKPIGACVACCRGYCNRLRTNG